MWNIDWGCQKPQSFSEQIICVLELNFVLEVHGALSTSSEILGFLHHLFIPVCVCGFHLSCIFFFNIISTIPMLYGINVKDI